MLVLKIKPHQPLRIGSAIVTVSKARGKAYKVRIDAPREVPISRGVQPVERKEAGT